MIRIEGLTKDYGGVRAVDNVSFEIRNGEILGLLGPNGAGKTSTLRMLTCYLAPTSGDIRVGDYNIREHPLQIKRMMGYLPEAAPLYHDMIVYDYLSFVAGVRGMGSEGALLRIERLAGLCGIHDVMHKPIATLSKGYRQRVGLAHAMMSDPEILVLDEPTSGLDPNQIVEIRDIIREIGRHKTVILSTHILSEAEATCDRLVIINKGAIVADGLTSELKRGAHGDSTVSIVLTGASPEEVGMMAGSVPGVGDVRDMGGGRYELGCRGAEDPRPHIYRAVKSHEAWVLLEMHMRGRDLEGIFRELTGAGAHEGGATGDA